MTDAGLDRGGEAGPEAGLDRDDEAGRDAETETLSDAGAEPRVEQVRDADAPPGEIGPGDLDALAAVAVVSGTPDDDELAALLAGLATARALARGEDDDAEDVGADGVLPHRSAWRSHARRLGVRATGPDVWRWSARR